MGSCCHRDDLILNPFDVYNIAKHLKKSMFEIIQDCCFVYIGSDSKLPIVSVKPRTHNKACPFLRKGKYVLHNTGAKPLSCRLFPLGRYHNPNDNDGYTYFLQDVDCGGQEKHTVREWIDADSIGEIDRMSLAWGKAVIDLSTYLRSINNTEKLEMAHKLVFFTTYINYDTNLEYVAQLEDNLDKLILRLPKFKRGN